MSIDFTFAPDVEEIRLKVRDFIETEVRPQEQKQAAAMEESGAKSGHKMSPDQRSDWIMMILKLREKAKEWGVWLPHMPTEWGGLGLGPTAIAAVSAEAAKSSIGPYVLNCYAPDEGNMHTLLHWGTEEQNSHYLKLLCDGFGRSCFAMTEPEVAGSDPTLIQTKAVQDGDDWIINGHKWFISGARSANFAILIARTEDNPEIPQAANSAFIVDIPSEGWELVRDVETMAGRDNHCEIRITNLRVPGRNMLGGRGQGHLLGQARLGPARLAHCMRWIGQIETALDMMVDRATKRYSHGSLLSDKQGIQWLIADSSMELYQAKLMVLHAAYRIENELPFKSEVSMAKHHVANTLWRVVDRAIQVHGALGYSTDTPLSEMLKQARWSRFADGADEIHQMTIAKRTIAAWEELGSTRTATGDLPL